MTRARSSSIVCELMRIANGHNRADGGLRTDSFGTFVPLYLVCSINGHACPWRTGRVWAAGSINSAVRIPMERGSNNWLVDRVESLLRSFSFFVLRYAIRWITENAKVCLRFSARVVESLPWRSVWHVANTTRTNTASGLGDYSNGVVDSDRLLLVELKLMR